ncbi:Cna B-type domain-containing protein [Anaerococcus sp. Marseille-P9784]|uniref:Cna B-type domain-containing protein n=1 Tax=Anaerococcus sp. Marseille-P9784 TaxID=2614127 RepID=UPI00124A6C27|nr:Cna B-type domain-containing protein [Anaerococcus sp. Marseille-P9784]
MKKKLLSGILALIFVIQIFVFGTAYAKGNDPNNPNLIKIGELTAKDYPKIDPADLAKLGKEKKQKTFGKRGGGATLFSTKSPYIQGQQPADPDKPKYWANVQGTLTTRGIDGSPFDWDKVLGKGQKVKLLFTQTNGYVMTGVTYTLLVDKDGTYTWKGSDGKPTYLPLYDVDGNPYTYNVQIQRNYSKDIQLIVQESNGTPKAKFRPEGDKQVATISFLDIEIRQLASTKFVSEWNTALAEADRPQIEGYFKVDDETYNTFNFPKNDTTRTILRESFLENFVEDEENETWPFISAELEITPQTVEVKTTTAGLTFEEADGVKTVTSGDHKFKYDFTYDVINGGKLTMTEVIPINFDANGGKFENFTAPDTETTIVKDVDYKEDLTEKAEDPTREGKTFKGWSTTVDGKIPATDDDFKNITEKKTFYAIWENNDIKAEELTVSESFNNGTEYVNDFIPSLETLKGQVKIKDANGVYQKLKDSDSLQILDDSGNPIADDNLKDNLYQKLKEDSSTEISRNITLKAKVNFADGTSQEIEIPIKVIKNIYEGTSTGGKPSYVPDDYVKVTVDPTDKATNSQKAYYYVNPAAKVPVPGENPVGKDDNIFTKWLIDGTETEYKFADRHQFSDATTIKAQYEKEQQGIINIKYVDGNGKEISSDYHIDGVDYPETKEGKLGDYAKEEDFPKKGPDFKGYYFVSRDSIKGKHYYDPATDTVTYTYDKIVTTDDKSKSWVYYAVIFDANGGKLGDKDKVTVYVRFDGNSNNVANVTFADVRKEAEKAGLATKEGAEFIEWQDKKVAGAKVADDYEIKVPDWDWDTYPENGYAPEVFYASWNEKIEYSIAKVWENSTNLTLADSDYPTMKFALYRQVEGGKEEKVADVEEKEITKDTLNAKWEGLPKSDPEGKEYKYFVKETFKENDIKNYNWILGDVKTSTNESGETVNTITNKLRTVPGDGETTDPKENFVGKLTIKKVLENEPVEAKASMSMMRAPKASEPLKFKFKVTGPYGYVSEEFELGANETKTLENLPFGQYKVEEIDSKGYTPDYSKEFETLTKDSPKGQITVTNKNEKSDTNENIIKVTVNKVWFGGGEKPATTIELWRKGYGLNGKEFEEYVDKFETTGGGENSQSKEFKELAKHDPSGKEFDYYAKEANVPNGYTATYSEDGLTVTNSLDIIKDDTPDDQTDKPDGYVTVTFKPGTNGKIDGDTKDIVYYVNPKADPVKTMAEIAEPSITANTGYKVAEPKWKDASGNALDKATEITKDLTYTAQYEKSDDIIKDPTPEDDSDKPEGYVTVTFKAGTNGKIDGNTKDIVYYVNPNADPVKVMENITPPTITANQGYKVADPSWKDANGDALDKATQITKDLTYTAQYEKYADVIPGKDPDTNKDNEKPDGFVTVRFLTNKNGTLTGETIYYVNPKAGKKMTDKDIKAPSITANDGYEVGSPKWKPDFTNDDSEIKEDRNYVANYDSLGKAEINYISMDTNMGTVSPAFEELKDGVDVVGSTATAKDGYKFVKWTDTKGTTVSTDAKFLPSKKESATYIAIFEKEDTTADKVKKLFDLEGVDLAAFVGDELTNDFWKDGVKSTEKTTSTFTEEEKTAIRDALNKATVSDKSERNTDHEVLSPSKGTLEIKFADGSVLTVLQKLYVYNNGSDKPKDPNQPTPKDSLEVTYKAGEGVKEFADKTVLVKKGTKEKDLPGKPETKAKEGYKDLKWTADPAIDETNGIQVNTTVSASAVVDNDYAKIDFTVNKSWQDEVNDMPTMNFTLYRKIAGGEEEKVDGVEVKEITQETTSATWKELPKTDSNGHEYIYSVKETFKDTSDVRNDNWILGEMEADESENSITNRLKTIPGEVETPSEENNRLGKLTITKKIESKPLTSAMSMAKAPAAPLEFTFKLIDPYGDVVKVDGKDTFTLKAGETKEFENLFYGDYTVEEIDAKGLTPFVKVGESAEKKSSTAKVTLTMTNKEGTVLFTNKNVIPDPNPNIIEVKATKIWVNGPRTDHKAIDLKLYRQVDGGSKEEVTDAKLDKSADVNDTSKFNYVWKNLPKINDDGKEYTYTVEEANVTDGKVKVNGNTYLVSQEGNTITNTFVVAKDDVKATKVWEGDLKAGEERPTTYFKLYRKIDDCKECQPVESAEVKELKAGTTEATWEDQDLTDENGNKYIYSVKEVDKDGKEATPEGYVKVENGLTVTNTKIAKDGKLTITKKLENEPKRMMMRAPSNNDPIKFKFTITKPDGNSEEFELKAGESKSFEDLTYGKYIVKETQTQGYTPYFAIGEGEQTQTEKFEVTVNSKEEVNLIVTNKNVINPNDLTVRATKIWVGGPKSDHTAVTLQLLRTSAKAGSEEEDVSKDYKVEANKDETSDTITYVWKNLPNHDGEGYKYTYKVKELGVGEDKIYRVGDNNYVSKVEDDTENTSNETTSFKITNTYQVPQTDDIIAKKMWKGLPEGTTKPIVKFQLYRKAQGSSLEEKVGEARDLQNDQVNFGKEDKTNQNGVEYIYFVKELDENGAEFKKENYKTSYDGLTVTNTYQQKPTPDPGTPGGEDPGKPGGEDPGKPGGEEPGKPGGEDPGTPGGEDPGKPGGEEPGKPGGEDPGTPGGEDPGTPGGEEPGKPGGEDPGTPGGEDPGTPGGEDPGKPGGEDPGTPGGEDPGKPGGEDPGTPGGEDPGKPGGEDPGTPGGEDPGKPGGEDPGKPGGEEPGDKPGNEPENGNKVVIPDKTGVKDKNHLTDEEKKKIIDKIKKVNPDVVDVVVDKKGNATLIYENGKKHTIPSDKLIYQIKKDNKKVSSSKTKKMKGNPRTSVSSISGVVATLLAATTGLFVSKKKDEEK